MDADHYEEWLKEHIATKQRHMAVIEAEVLSLQTALRKYQDTRQKAPEVPASALKSGISR